MNHIPSNIINNLRAVLTDECGLYVYGMVVTQHPTASYNDEYVIVVQEPCEYVVLSYNSVDNIIYNANTHWSLNAALHDRRQRLLTAMPVLD